MEKLTREEIMELMNFDPDFVADEFTSLAAENARLRLGCEAMADEFGEFADSADNVMDYKASAIWGKAEGRARTLLADSKGEDDA